MALVSPFFDSLRAAVRANGGLHNAHLHLDRAFTLEPTDNGLHANGSPFRSSISLKEKHSLISSLHASDAYNEESLRRRLGLVLSQLKECGTRMADSVIDVTDDRVGMTALNIAKELASHIAPDMTLRLASYNPFGFPKGDLRRWTLFEEGAKSADFIGSLPERDDQDDYPDHIGFEESCARVLDLARRLGKFVHVHTDQKNDPRENATERLVDIVRKEGAPKSDDGRPMVWAIHVISPSTYDERRFERLVDGLLETNIGIVCCPSGALGMRQIRSNLTPTYNSIARVLEFVDRGVHVRLGSDNIADMCSPSTTADLIDEVYVLSAALRFYDVPILAKLASGKGLSADENERLGEHLAHNAREATIASRPAKTARQTNDMGFARTSP